MRNMFLTTTAVVALSTAASYASAQSIPSGDELWTGGFIGIGGSFLDVSGDMYFEGYTEGGGSLNGNFETEGFNFGEGPAVGSGAFGIIEVGADKQVNQMVYGGFASFDFGSADATTEAISHAWQHVNVGACEGFGSYPCDASVSATISVGNNWAIGGRAGYLAGPNTLIYGLAGISSAKMSVSVDTTLNGFFAGESDLTVGTSSPEFDVSGTTFGAGVEHLFANSWSMKLEYRSTVYDGSALNGGGLTAFEGVNYDGFTEGMTEVMDIGIQSVRATVNYRF